MVSLYQGSLLSNKQEPSTATWVDLQRIVLSEKSPVPIGYMPSEPIEVTFMKCNIILMEMESWLVVVGVKEGAGVAGYRATWASLCRWAFLHLDFLRVSILLVMLPYSFARWCHWGNWLEGTCSLSVVSVLNSFTYVFFWLHWVFIAVRAFL